jgi:hypothetical protein
MLAKLSPESEKDFRECFIEDPATGHIRFTTKGRAEYRSQFARAGFDIRRIRTREDFRACGAQIFNRSWRALGSLCERGCSMGTYRRQNM